MCTSDGGKPFTDKAEKGMFFVASGAVDVEVEVACQKKRMVKLCMADERTEHLEPMGRGQVHNNQVEAWGDWRKGDESSLNAPRNQDVGRVADSARGGEL